MASDFDRLMEQLRAQLAALETIARVVSRPLDVTVHHVQSPDVNLKLDKILAQGATIMTQLDDLNAKLSIMEADVTHITNVGDSMEALLSLIKAMLDAAIGGATDLSTAQQRVAAVSATIEAKTTEWAAAVVANTPPPVGGNTIALPPGTVGAAYSVTLDPVTGLAPFSNSISSGALPDGLTADATAPLISGTFTAAGGFAFQWKSTDADPETPNVFRNYTITVVP